MIPTFPILPTEGKAFANAMVPRYAPAECSPRCDDPQCHYAHSDSWWVGKNGPFDTREEAAQFVCREPDPLDVAETWIEAGATIRAIGWAIMSARSADLTPQERTDARAAARTVLEELERMEKK